MKKFKNIYIEITNVCNLNCSFCPKTKRTAKTMTAIEFAHVLNKVVKHTEYIYLHVVGEPLLNPELDKILSCCDQKNVKIKLTTNGTFLKEKLEALIIHPSIKAINISLSCIKDFDDITTKNYLEDVFFAAKRLSQNKITTTLRVWTDTKYNLIIKKKVYDDFNTDILPTVNGIQKIASYLLFDVEREFVWPIMSTAASSLENNCLGLRGQLAILSDGTVVPCCLDNDGKLNLGNLFTNSLEEILNSERAVKIAQGFKDSKAAESFCKVCTFSNK